MAAFAGAIRFGGLDPGRRSVLCVNKLSEPTWYVWPNGADKVDRIAIEDTDVGRMTSLLANVNSRYTTISAPNARKLLDEKLHIWDWYRYDEYLTKYTPYQKNKRRAVIQAANILQYTGQGFAPQCQEITDLIEGRDKALSDGHVANLHDLADSYILALACQYYFEDK